MSELRNDKPMRYFVVFPSALHHLQYLYYSGLLLCSLFSNGPSHCCCVDCPVPQTALAIVFSLHVSAASVAMSSCIYSHEGA
ncbi:hypothetical protein BKA82DRAFT_2540110 [Pisolithus tinctorius]|nr:hypothetical protein BKA82DRAFT_2540110 [Pisolithus tinctorius]